MALHAWFPLLGAFLLIVPLAYGDGGTPHAVIVRDLNGNGVSVIRPDEQVVFEAPVDNPDPSRVQPFVVLMEVRDVNGVTQFLAWQKGTLSAGVESSTIGISWRAGAAGDYQVRSFVLDNMENPTVLADVRTTNVSVT